MGHNTRTSLIRGESRPILDRFRITSFLEEFLVTGVMEQKRIGKVIISSETSRFDRNEKDILDIFVSFIQQRLVDFNKDWRRLSHFFSVSQRIRLLEKTDYMETDLMPRIAPVAIMYADISSFTFFSEQVLKEPRIITQLIDIWASEAISAIWANGGCFDKLVGDCVIGHFGPPFYNLPPLQNCLNALTAAARIIESTMNLLNRDEKCFSLIRESEHAKMFGVSIGVNFGEVNVGIIGPNADFTCFGGSMNNAARIQGAADRNEILLLKPVFEQVKDWCRLEGPFSVELKSVQGQVEYYRFLAFNPVAEDHQ